MKLNFIPLIFSLMFFIACGSIENPNKEVNKGGKEGTLSDIKGNDSQESDSNKTKDDPNSNDPESSNENKTEPGKTEKLPEELNPESKKYDPKKLAQDNKNFCKATYSKAKKCGINIPLGETQCTGLLGRAPVSMKESLAKCLSEGCSDLQKCMENSLGAGSSSGGSSGGIGRPPGNSGSSSTGNSTGSSGQGNSYQTRYNDAKKICDSMEKRNDECKDPEWSDRDFRSCVIGFMRVAKNTHNSASQCLKLQCINIQDCIDNL